MKSYNTILKENRAWAEETFKKIDTKMQAVAQRSRNKLPDGVDENGVHIDLAEKNPNGWTAGFWGALNCILYEYTKNEEYLKTAESSMQIGRAHV